MNEMKVGSTVESMTSESALTVKILGNNQVVVQTETGKLDVLPPDELYLVPGDDYCRLRRIVIDTMDKLTKEIGRNNVNSTRFQLALSRALYAADVRRGEEDMVNQIQTKITMVVSDSVSSGDIADIIRMNMHRKSLPTAPIFTPARPDIEEVSDAPTVLHHTDISGHSETLVQQLNDDELALMCCDVADMLANSMGFTADMMHLASSRYSALSQLQRRVTYWSEPRGNVRKTQVWEMAKKVVGHCRMAEVEDAIENVHEAIRQMEDPDEE